MLLRNASGIVMEKHTQIGAFSANYADGKFMEFNVTI